MPKIISLCSLVFLIVLAACDSDAPTPTPGALPAQTSTPTNGIAPPTVAAPVASPVPSLGTSGVTTTVLTGFPAGVTSLAWSPDGSLLAAGVGGIGSAASVSGTDAIWLWRLDGTLASKWEDKTGVAPPTPDAAPSRAPSGGIMALAWSPDGSLLASGSGDGTVRLWSKDGELVRALQTNSGTIFSLSWTPDSQKLAVGALKSTTDNRALVWSRDGTLLNTLHTRYSGGKFYNVEWSPDGKYLVSGATDYALWTANGMEIANTGGSEHSTPAWGMAWSPDSKMWVIGNESGEIEVYDTKGKQLSFMHASSSVNVIAWSPDGSVIVCSNEVFTSDGTQIGGLEGLGQDVKTLAWSPDGKMIAGGTERGIVGVFSASRQRIERFAISAESGPGPRYAINRVAWSPDGNILAAGADDKAVWLWRVGGR